MKRLVALGISLVILGVIYWTIDVQELGRILLQANAWWMAVSLAMVVPLTLLTAWRLQQLMPRGGRLGWGRANRLILMASSMNMVLPSKMGDLAKAYFMKGRGGLDGSLAVSLVVFEKACDMLSLLLWCVFGLLLLPDGSWLFWTMIGPVTFGLVLGVLVLGSRQVAHACFAAGGALLPGQLKGRVEDLKRSWDELHEYLVSDKVRLLKVGSTSIGIWFLHLVQIWLFILALNAWAPFLSSLALTPLAILAGLLPVTIAGMGTRDSALIVLYQGFFSAPTAAALGLLCMSRYLLPALAGLPFLSHDVATLRDLRTPRSGPERLESDAEELARGRVVPKAAS